MEVTVRPSRPTPTTDLPVNEPIRHVDVYGGHGWLVYDGTVWTLEHCQYGRWGRCQLGEHADLRSARKAAMRHLRRQPHVFDELPRLSGVTHAGGGRQIAGRWIKGPGR